jgi:hypothetical protein
MKHHLFLYWQRAWDAHWRLYACGWYQLAIPATWALIGLETLVGQRKLAIAFEHEGKHYRGFVREVEA